MHQRLLLFVWFLFYLFSHVRRTHTTYVLYSVRFHISRKISVIVVNKLKINQWRYEASRTLLNEITISHQINPSHEFEIPSYPSFLSLTEIIEKISFFLTLVVIVEGRFVPFAKIYLKMKKIK